MRFLTVLFAAVLYVAVLCVAILCVAILLVASNSSLIADDAARKASLKSAEELFREGKFEEAEYRFAALEKDISFRYESALYLGAIALYRNDLEAADRHLQGALKIVPDSKQVKRVLINVYYRGDKFTQAAPLYHAIGEETASKKFESFAGLKPYDISGNSDATHVHFVVTDPLPLIEAKLNGRSVNFVIDTGAAELYIDPDVAKKAKVPQFGSVTRKGYAGGLKATTGQGRVESIAFGNTTIRNIPVQILNTRRFSGAVQGKRVDGVLGTSLLSHFVSTLDFPKGELVLRPKTPDQIRQFEELVKNGRGTAMPFWIAGDHFIVTWGKVYQSPPLLFFVDTGLAGGGFICPASTLKDAGIRVPQGSEIEGIGGGGTLKVVPFTVPYLSVGGVDAHDIQSFLGAFPPTLEYGEGFRIAGMVSHEFFRPYALTFDFEGMRLFVTKNRN
jgi:Aspartyl protease